MIAERWMKHLEMMEKVRHDSIKREKTQAAEQERIRQEAEERAWRREIEAEMQRASRSAESYSSHCKGVNKKMDENTQAKIDEYICLLSRLKEQVGENALAILQEIKKDERVARIHRERSFNGDAPATENQLEYLRDLGAVIPEDGLTRCQASTLIENTKAAIREMKKAGKVPIRVP